IGRWCPHLRFSWLGMRITLSATSDQLPHHATYDFQPVLPGREGHSRTKDSTDYLKLAAYNNAAGRELRLTSTCGAPPSSTMPSRRDFVSRVRGDVVCQPVGCRRDAPPDLREFWGLTLGCSRGVRVQEITPFRTAYRMSSAVLCRLSFWKILLRCVST